MRPFHSSYSLFPETTGAFNVGSESLRWLEGFFTNLNVSTRATVPTPVASTDAATKGYVDALFVPTIATIEEADGSPSITNPTTLRVDQADGLVLTNPSTGVARLDLVDVPYSVLQNVSATDMVLGRSTVGAGDIEEIACTAAGRALLDDATAAIQRATLGSTTVGDAVFIAASAAAARTAIGAVIGTDVEVWDADLDALASLAATAGMLSRTGAGAFAVRTLTGTADRITVTNGTGAAANPTFDVGTNVYTIGGTDVALADGGTGVSLADPAADRIMFWDDSAGVVTWLTAGTGLTITDTTMTAAGGPSAASQAEMETAASTTVYTSPGTTQYHPGVAKTWNQHNDAGTVAASYNVSSVTDSGTGDHSVNLTTAMSSGALMTIVGSPQYDNQDIAQFVRNIASVYDHNGRDMLVPATAADLNEWYSAAFGDQ